MIKKSFIAAIPVIVVFPVVVIAATAGSHPAAGQNPGMRDATPAEAGQGPVPSAIAARYAVFRRDRDQGDSLPEAARQSLFVREHSAIIAESRRVRSSERESALYLVAGERGALCLVDESGAGGCNSDTETAKGYNVGSETSTPDLEKGEYRVAGVVPDGVGEVVISQSRGAPLSVPVEQNVYEVVTTSAPDTVSWRDAGGSQVTVPIPH